MTDLQGNAVGDYCVDLVMCIDATMSMAPILEEVKENAISFYGKFVEAMEEAGKDVEKLRIRVIAFRDFKADDEPIVDSANFFDLPDESEAFESFVRGIEPSGGGDVPENALEAIALAVKSEWTTQGDKQRHVILVFTDAPAHELGKLAGESSYPEGMPADLATLGSWWEGVDQSAVGTYKRKFGRMVVFAPEAYPWTEMRAWNRYWFVPSKAGLGLEEVDMNEAMDVLVGSID